MTYTNRLIIYFRILRRKLELRPKWWVLAPLSFAMGLIYSTGPLVQRYLFALITSDETSIYGSSFQHEAVKLPKLDDWFEAALTWPHPGIGLIVVALAARSPSIKEMFLKLSLFGFITLMLFDIGYALIGNTLTVASIFENLVANFVGSIGAAAIAVLLLELANYGFCSFDWSIWPKRGIAGFLVMLGGALALCAIFYLTDFFYRPRPANIDLMVEAPAHGFIIAEATPKFARDTESKTKNTDEPFVLVSQIEESASLNWRAPKMGKISWSKNENTTSYDVELSLFTGCGPTESEHKLPVSKSLFLTSNTRNFSLWHDWGAWDTTITAEKGYGTSKLTGTEATFFAVNRSSDGKSIELQQLAANKSQVTYSGGAGSLEIFMITPPVKPDEATAVTPSLHFNVNGIDHVININSSASNDSSETVACLAASTRDAFERKVLDLGDSSLLGVRLRISPTSKSVTLSDNVVTLNGDGGWVTVKGVDPQSFDTSGKRIDMITLSGNLKAATINGDDRALKVGDSYVAVGGDIKGSFVSGLFKVTGSAELLWADSDRANQTKWESLPIEYKILFLAFLGSVFVWIYRRVSMQVANSKKLPWLKDGI